MQGGEHYHVSVKLSGPRRWRAVRAFLANRHGINVNLSDSHHNYYSAYCYVTKQDKSVYLSPGHPNLSTIGSPKAGKCIRAYREKSRRRKSIDDNSGDPSTSTASSGRIPRVSNLDLSEFIVENGIRSTDELLAAAKQRQQEGNKDLANFLIGRCVKKLRELVDNTWAMETSRERLARANMSRMEIVQEAADGDCVEGCQGEWYNCAFEMLTNNGINPVTFAAALRSLLQKGRGKCLNIMIVGPANCG